MKIMMIGEVTTLQHATLVAAARRCIAQLSFYATACDAVAALSDPLATPTGILVSDVSELGAIQSWLERRFDLHAVPVVLVSSRDKDDCAREVAMDSGCADVLALSDVERVERQLRHLVGYRPAIRPVARFGETWPAPPPPF